MNTKTEIDKLTSQVCELLDLTLSEVVEAQVDLALDYFQGLVERGWLESKDDAQLMGQLPEFWGWWRQRWANHDRQLLAEVSRLTVLEWKRSGLSLMPLYRHSCRRLNDPYTFPNDVIMAAFRAEKRKQNTLFNSLKNLFHA
ncbi:hypothetical protein [Hymenobacter rubripertinctus]|uniref:Uncharacterized protein n=1 Tax=Hymenobacter rubripertinctus TaxID=2029981 RepID=A0A418QMN9_9BACT|nr:hypothetical protein [Hymenobacter rubripertinctus]RIY06486.1 hypothetical protein D0T11_18775 [Hymenobacter rubripertinctus]